MNPRSSLDVSPHVPSATIVSVVWMDSGETTGQALKRYGEIDLDMHGELRVAWISLS